MASRPDAPSPALLAEVRAMQARGPSGRQILLDQTFETLGLRGDPPTSPAALIEAAGLPSSIEKLDDYQRTELGATYALTNSCGQDAHLAARLDHDRSSFSRLIGEAADWERIGHMVTQREFDGAPNLQRQFNIWPEDSHPVTPLQLIAAVLLNRERPNWLSDYEPSRVEDDFARCPDHRVGERLPMWLHGMRALMLGDTDLAARVMEFVRELEGRASGIQRQDAHSMSIGKAAAAILADDANAATAALRQQLDAFAHFLAVPYNHHEWMRWTDRGAKFFSVDLQAAAALVIARERGLSVTLTDPLVPVWLVGKARDLSGVSALRSTDGGWAIELTGWLPGLNKVALANALRDLSTCDLAQAQAAVQELLDGGEPEARFDTRELVRAFEHVAGELGVELKPTEIPPTLFADWHNADAQGRVRLNCTGTLEDLESLQLTLRDGLRVRLDDGEELSADAVVAFSSDEGLWVATMIGELELRSSR